MTKHKKKQGLQTFRSDVMRVCLAAQKYQSAVAGRKLTDAEGVIETLRVAVRESKGDRFVFLQLIANVLVNLDVWLDAPLNYMRPALILGNPQTLFVPFSDGGFCRYLRDNFYFDYGNLPHHMFSYYVMTNFLNVITEVGVVVHELDSWSKGSNPEGPGDLRSGTLGVNLSLGAAAGFEHISLLPERVKEKTIPYCRHFECQNPGNPTKESLNEATKRITPITEVNLTGKPTKTPPQKPMIVRLR